MNTGIIGLVGSLPPHLRIDENPNLGRVGFIDFGLSEKQAKKKFLPGDIILLEQNFTKVGKNRVISSGLDNKVGVHMSY